MKLTLIIAMIFSSSLFAFGQTANGKAEREVIKTNEEYDRAIVKRDAAAYEKIVDDEFVFTDFRGAVTNKAQELEKIKTRPTKFEFGKSDDMRVKIYGNTAVVTGRFSAKGQSDGKDFTFAERYTAVFVKRGKIWRLVAEQSTEIAPK